MNRSIMFLGTIFLSNTVLMIAALSQTCPPRPGFPPYWCMSPPPPPPSPWNGAMIKPGLSPPGAMPLKRGEKAVPPIPADPYNPYSRTSPSLPPANPGQSPAQPRQWYSPRTTDDQPRRPPPIDPARPRSIDDDQRYYTYRCEIDEDEDDAGDVCRFRSSTRMRIGDDCTCGRQDGSIVR
jgi:hypothetical protein